MFIKMCMLKKIFDLQPDEKLNKEDDKLIRREENLILCATET